MRILVVEPDPHAREQTVAGLAARLPDAQVLPWPQHQDQADYAVGWSPPPEFFASQPRLKAFFGLGAGLDQVLRVPTLPPQLVLVRLEDAGMARQMAEYCCHEVFRIYRHYGVFEAQQRARLWRKLTAPPGRGFAVGVLGMGVLGTHVARTLSGFGYRVLGHCRSPHAVEGVECHAGAQALPGFLSRCQVLILMAPLTPDTQDLIDARTLALLPRGAWLVNVARGGLVVDEALIAALDSGQLAGATLDVFRTEPLAPEHPFWRHPRIRVTPHIAAFTMLDESVEQIAGKIARLERDEPISGVVERNRGY